MFEGRHNIQGNDNLEKWAHMNLIKLNRAECMILHLDRGNGQYQHRLGSELRAALRETLGAIGG